MSEKVIYAALIGVLVQQIIILRWAARQYWREMDNKGKVIFGSLASVVMTMMFGLTFLVVIQ